MAIVIESFSENSAVPGNSLVLDKPTGLAVGDLIVIIVGNDDATNTDQWDNSTLKPTGFTLINEAGTSTTDAHAGAFYKVADSGDVAASTFTVPAQSSNDFWGFCLRLSGVDVTNPVPHVGSDSNDTSDPYSITGVTTTVADCLAFAVMALDGGDGGTISVSGTGWSVQDQRQAGTGAGNAMGAYATRQMSGTGATGTANFSTSTNDDGVSGFQFAVAPATFGITSVDSTDFGNGSSEFNLDDDDVVINGVGFVAAMAVYLAEESTLAASSAEVSISTVVNSESSSAYQLSFVNEGDSTVHGNIESLIAAEGHSLHLIMFHASTGESSIPVTVHRAKAFNLSASSNITASGENTTAQLTPPSGKTTGDFGGGRIQDDENPGDAVDLGEDEYREDEWSIIGVDPDFGYLGAQTGETYDFRLLIGGEVIDTYTVTPQITIGLATVELAATSAPVSTFSANLRVVNQLSATSASTSSVTADLDNIHTVELSATSASTSSLSADLQITIDDSATFAPTSTFSADLLQTHALSATSASSSSVTAALSVTRNLSATSAAQSVLSADLNLTLLLSATSSPTSALSAALTQTHELSASSDPESSVSADLFQVHNLSATSGAVSTFSADVALTLMLSATSAVQSSASAALTQTHELSASSDPATSVSADLLQVHNLSATSAPTSSLAADLDNIGVLQFTATSAPTSQFTAALSVTHALSATSASVSSTSADLDQIIEFSATSAPVSTFTSDLLQVHELSATSSATSSLTAQLEIEGVVQLSATSAAQSTTSASLLQVHALSATSAAQSAVTADLSTQGVVLLSATSAAQSTLDADLLVVNALSATSAAQSSFTAALSQSGVNLLSASFSPSGTVAASILQVHKLSASASPESTFVAAVLDTLALLGANVSAESSVVADLEVTSTLGASFASTSVLTGNLTLVYQLSATSTAVLTATATLYNRGPITFGTVVLGSVSVGGSSLSTSRVGFNVTANAQDPEIIDSGPVGNVSLETL